VYGLGATEAEELQARINTTLSEAGAFYALAAERNAILPPGYFGRVETILAAGPTHAALEAAETLRNDARAIAWTPPSNMFTDPMPHLVHWRNPWLWGAAATVGLTSWGIWALVRWWRAR
jgi:hypothetical protein